MAKKRKLKDLEDQGWGKPMSKKNYNRVKDTTNRSTPKERQNHAPFVDNPDLFDEIDWNDDGTED